MRIGSPLNSSCSDVTDISELPSRISATLTGAEATVLKMMLADVQRFGSAPGDDRESQEMRLWGVRYRPSRWHGGPVSAASRQAYSRATQRLARAGLIDRVTETRRDRVSWLQFTWLGLFTALELLPDADRTLVFEGLCRTEWGAGLVPQPDVEMPLDVGMLPDSVLGE